jgi:hypothetical protein
MTDFEEVFDEALVKVSKADKALYFFDAFENGPINNSFNLDCVMEHSLYPVFYSDFPLFLLILLSPLEAFLAFAQSKHPSQHLTMCALLSFFLMPIKCPGTPVVHQLL